MAVCTYDNPNTMARECWQNGELICHYQATLFFIEARIPASSFFFGANIGKWKTGQLKGDIKAMDKAT